MAQLSEREKMLRGELFVSFTPDLIAARNRCKYAYTRYNNAGEVPRRRLVELWKDVIEDKTPLPPQLDDPVADDELFKDEPWIEPPVKADYGFNVIIGKNVFINSNCVMIDSLPITIGSRTLFGPNVSLFAGTHPVDPAVRNGMEGPEMGAPITIGEDCWIGGNVTILPGVTIGKGSTVGAGSVVTKNDSMEESDPERVQKRPRLDSGSGINPTISIDAAAAVAAASGSAPASTVATPPPAPALEMDTSPDQTRPAKVTINVKSPTSETNLANGMRGSSPVPEGTPTRPDSTEPIETASDVISISSSPARSPEIQAGEPEDMDGNWQTLEDAIQEEDVVEVEDLAPSLVDSFPRVRENLSARDNLVRIVALIQKAGPRDAEAASAVKTWMDDCVKNLDRLTLEEFGEDQEFWQQFPDVVESLLRRTHELLIDDGSGSGPWICLEEFLLDYVQIALQVMRIDTLILRHLVDDPELPVDDSICKDYLQALTFVLLSPKSPIPLYRALEKKYPTDTIDMLVRIRAKALAPPIELVHTLSQWTALILDLIPRHPHLTSLLGHIMLIANALADSHLERQSNADVDNIAPPLLDTPPIRALYEMVRSIDEKYQEWISKKAAWATSDLSEQLMRAISHHYKHHCTRNPEFVNQLAQDLSIRLPENTNQAENSLILFWTWKLAVLKKHIMEGRMELRVYGVETMQSDLVNVWRTNISSNPDGVNLPFVQALVRYIKNNKIVDYLVGVDSHPQLISRSSNIIGFLIVTDTYDDSVTNVIWKTVTDSQDGRIVSEVLAMLIRTFNMHITASPALLYVCQKVLDLPLSRFDTNMLEFCNKLLSRMSDQPPDRRISGSSEHDHVDARPLQLCVRLIRDCTGADDLSMEQKKSLQKFGSQKLMGFITAGISQADRMAIYMRCITDIAENNEFAAGSIQTLSALVPAHDVQEILKLAKDFDLTALVINNMLHAMNEDHDDSANDFFEIGLVSRLNILFRLIDKVPETITPELGKTLWDDILLSKKLGADGRQAVWNMLVTALSKCAEANSFFHRCIHEYLPSLVPSDYTHEILAFAKQAMVYEVRYNPPPPAGEGEVVTIPGLDRIWTFILTAPPGTIEVEATEFAVKVYLDHAIVTHSPRSAIEATHIFLVERCVDQLKSAAATLKAASEANGVSFMESETETGEMSPEELRFRRSLYFLHQLLSGLRDRPHYNSPRASPPVLPERPVKGDLINISWQSFNGSANSKVQELQIGDLSTAGELVECLTQLTGFSKFSSIAGGQRVDLLKDPEATLRSMKVLHGGLLLVRKAPDAKEVSQASSGGLPLTSVDSEVLKHFDELYDLLTLNDDLAREIYEFLVTFSPQPRVRNLVKSETSAAKELFPFDKPFVAFYSFSALLACLIEEALEDTANQAFISHSIEVLVTILMADELADSLTLDRHRLSLASTAVECLLDAIALYQATDNRTLVAQGQVALVRRLLHFIEAARSVTARPPVNVLAIQKLVCNSFGVLMEGAIRDKTFWGAVKQETQLGSLVKGLLLEETRQSIRSDVSERIKRTCNSAKSMKQSTKLTNDNSPILSTPDSPAQIDILATVWDAFIQTIPMTLDYAPQSAEFFNVALGIFRSVAEKSPRDVIFSQYLKQWSEIMLRHETEEFIGREPVDNLVLGFAGLLEQCLESADSANVDLETFDLAEQIISKYLFPELANENDEVIVPRTPHMHTETRQKLYNILRLLCKRNGENVARIMRHLEGVIPRDESYSPTWCHDRSKMIRAPEGYAGLRNLSNTCYLNSLMTQLFMNPEFRKFLLGLNIMDPNESQKLLDETQKLFAWMQDTWMKSVDPEGFVESIRTYDNEAIDVTIQMDVDEFYNLLFDRWEAQIMDPEEKKKFRSFYGGQLVQQIKSKECSHISEREEPFSAIQCDIKGKASLDESLQAYVEGEIMQGDNKYFCSGCGRHVDAVKRACLKDVPDNLIFHLKRFDFDMVTMMRSKINDEFQFPRLIDMTPYKVEYLSEPSAPVEPDVFELVGVLVHTGTAESGHYYSYTRERSSNGSAPLWVEFNDSDVSKFDPTTIADHCFGGQTEAGHSMGGVQINKVWNAYMLFYQRVSTMEQTEQVTQPFKPNYPARVPVPTPFANHIAMDNELFIRTYCLLEPAYMKLVPELLYRVRQMDPNAAAHHQLQVMGIELGLDTLEQLIARTKEPVGLLGVYEELRMLIRSPHGALRALHWFARWPTTMRNLVLRIFQYDVRQKEMSIIVEAVRCLKVSLEGAGIDDETRATWQKELEETVDTIVSMLAELWPALHTIPRVWDEYFEFLIKLIELGEETTNAMLANGMLVNCLEIIWLDSEDRKNLKGRYPGYCRLLEKGRQFPYRNLMTFCAMLFQRVDLSLAPSAPDVPRKVGPDGRPSLSAAENRYIKPLEFQKPDDDTGVLVFLMKLLQHDQICVQTEVSQAIVAAFLTAGPQAGFEPHVLKTLQVGLRFSPVELCIPFLECAVPFCKYASDENAIISLISFVAKGVDSINNSAGNEHLEFFTQLCSISNEPLGLEPDWFIAAVQDRIPEFVPTLLIYNHPNVRRRTTEVLRGLLFIGDKDEMTEEARTRLAHIARELTRACVQRIASVFLNSQVQSVESRIVYPITSTVTHCLETYFDEDNEEDERQIERANTILLRLQEITVDVPDDLVSDSEIASPEEWEATSALASDSEMGLAGTP
ncbi:Ubiquitin carboxyl-terminal hydrolase 34 [Penicillium rolfsii]|nr:Ubiquitin carboxyl-terminal hydrolase 34 [Penicillium rolfsii]